MNKTEYIIRAAIETDIEDIAKTNLLAWHQTYPGIFNDELLANLKLETFTENRRNGFANPNKVTFIALQNQKIVGFCDVGRARNISSVDVIDNSFGEIYALYVLTQHQGKGLGRELLKQAQEYLKNSGYKKNIIWAIEENKLAIKFYLHMGYLKTTYQKYFTINQWQHAEIALTYDLYPKFAQ